MCGRTACTLDPNQTRRACTYTNRQGRRVLPRWRNGPSGNQGNTGGKQQQQGKQQGKQQALQEGKGRRKYYPSFNLTPTAVTPVLLSAKHFDSEAASDDRQLTPMQWGLVPSWHKGDPTALGYKMNNCRREGMTGKRSFSRPLDKGQRCVVLADGYYEWLTSKDGKKQPYFIYFPQATPIESLASKTPPAEPEPVEQPDCLAEEEVTDEGSEWKGHKLLTMAGLFDRWFPPEGGPPLYTYTVITVEAASSMSWLHNRMPAILESDQAINDWLDYGTVPASKALELIKAETCLTCHPVSTQVNNSRYKGSDCIVPIDVGKPEKQTASSKMMGAWLAKGAKPSPSKDTKQEVKQEIKLEVESSPQKVLRSSPRKQEQGLRSSPRKRTAMTDWLSKTNPGLKVKVEPGAPAAGSPPKKAKIR
ncbi:embryonic stem cell-specific 5-hydroxymethylcytosine-binding protein-like [Acanthaster planci]|uniref:Abasic site processing protein HMCES n=1 Tax=Acanthaster planci TaxID=133434 RepID=A0A8B8A1J9_ACAPL|nr:embryonic stem cell-specific 5-hydroxymethylcytosine-binding protein-like [Acanthaster planci]